MLFGCSAVRRVLPGLVLCLTVPLLALLCRGHSPSRYAAANLPFWERQPPAPAPPRGAFWGVPLAPEAVHIRPQAAALRPLLAVDDDRLLAGVEGAGDPPASGQAGAWLESACSQGRGDARLRAKQDRIAARLMNTQMSDGSLGPRAPGPRWTDAAGEAYAWNLRGLLAYYRATRSPAAVYTAVAAGDLLVGQWERERTSTTRRADRLLTLPVAQLYQATGDTKFLAFALRLSRRVPPDGPAACALYQATGQTRFLGRAQALWQLGARSPDLSARLLFLTGSPAYAGALNRSAVRADAVYANTPGGLAVSRYIDSQAAVGPVRLRQHTDRRTRQTLLSFPMARPAAFSLRLWIPGDATAIALHPARPQPGAKPARLILARRTGRFLTWARRWSPGDTLILSRGPAAGRPPATSLPARKPNT